MNGEVERALEPESGDLDVSLNSLPNSWQNPEHCPSCWVQGLLPPVAASPAGCVPASFPAPAVPRACHPRLCRPGSALPRTLHRDLPAARGVCLSRPPVPRACQIQRVLRVASLPPPYPRAPTMGKALEARTQGSAWGEARVRGQEGCPRPWHSLEGLGPSTPEGLPGRGALGHRPINGSSWDPELWAL